MANKSKEVLFASKVGGGRTYIIPTGTCPLVDKCN